MSVTCMQPGCTKTWLRDPVNSVPCPKCKAKPGRTCKRPSQHQVWEAWGRFHKERDFAAAAAGAYHHDCTEPCPKTCGTCYPLLKQPTKEEAP